jgi:hypothetical protein
VIFYTPAPDGPPSDKWRTFNYSFPPSGCAGVDFRGIDQEAEVAAFRSAFKPELDTLTQRIGRPPVLRWGMIYTYG